MDIRPNVNEMGHYVLTVVAFGKGPLCVDRGPILAASYFECTFLLRRRDLSSGGLRLPFTNDGLPRCVSPEVFLACTAVTLGGAYDDSVSDPQTVFTKLHVNWDVRQLTS